MKADLLAEFLPLVASSPVTLIAAVVWWELRTCKTQISKINERLAIIEIQVLPK